MDTLTVELVRWAIGQGALAGVLLIILFFLRRDAKTQGEESKSSIMLLQALVERSTTAHVESTAASRATREAVDRLSGVISGLEGALTLDPEIREAIRVRPRRP